MQLSGTLSQLSQALLHLKGRPFNFDGYEFFPEIYDTPWQGLLMKCARQVAKSTAISNIMAVRGACIPHFTSLYVAPTEHQVSTFNKQKLDSTLRHSPDFRRLWFGKGATNQALHKKLTNGSDIILRSCFFSADSIRGITSDQVCVDEVQDILADNIHVIRECMTRSEYKYLQMAGTPKTKQHAIEFYWERSTKHEWLPRCVSCNRYNLLGEENVQPKGLSCARCSAFLDPLRGEWVATNTSGKATLDGYRVSQLMVPWIPWSGVDGSIWDKYTTYPRAKFWNEVLALPFDDATCPISVDELMDACDPNLPMVSCREDRPALAGMRLAAGVDWGTGQEGASYTVLTIGGFLPDGRFVVVFSKRYSAKESDPEVQLKDIIKICTKFRVNVVGLDWGLGFGMNSRIQLEFGQESVHIFYNSDNQRQPMKYDRHGERWVLSRTLIMTDVFGYLRSRQIVLPRWDAIKDLAADALNIFATYATRMGSLVLRYDHPEGKPDDWFHSLIYSYMAAVISRQS